MHADIFFFFGMSTRYAYLEDDGFGLWLMLSDDQKFWILAHVFRGLGFLDLGSCFQRTKGFWTLAHAFRGPKIALLATSMLDLESSPRRAIIVPPLRLPSKVFQFFILSLFLSYIFGFAMV